MRVSICQDSNVVGKVRLTMSGKCCNCCPKPLNSTLHEYAETTTIHGIAYIFESGRMCLERIAWVILFALALFLALTLSVSAYDSWIQDPVLTSGARVFHIPHIPKPKNCFHLCDYIL